MKRVLAIVVVCGCASGKGSATTDADVGHPVDAKQFLDGQIEQNPDAALPHPDAMVDARPLDAFVFLDACVPQVTELLVNPVFELQPVGTGWTQTPIDAMYPPITSDNGQTSQYPPQSAPYKAWLGGFIAPSVGQTVTDVVYQDVAVPASTTQLVITGYYLVDTTETSTTTVYDSGSLALLQTNGTAIEGVLAKTNLTPTGQVWTQFSHTFTSNVAGMTVRLQMTSSNDYSNVTNFMFDTLSLKATHCP
jgi:hypothetical protein